MKNENEQFLEICDRMVEVDFQKRVVKPLLGALGATAIEHTHGNNERGKDFLYVIQSPYKTLDLHACVVKNGPFNGRVGDSNSVQYALSQIETAKKTLALNPITNHKEVPKSILFIASRNLPDKVSGDLQLYLETVRDYCSFITGEEFVKVVRQLCEHVFLEIIHPGKLIGAKLQLALRQHNEANLFNLPSNVSSRVFVDMRLICQGEQFESKEYDTSRRPRKVDKVEKRLASFILGYQECMRDVCRYPEILKLRDASEMVQQQSSVASVFVEKLDARELKDFIQSVHADRVEFLHPDKKGDLVFGQYKLLGELSKILGDGNLGKLDDKAMGAFGDKVDAVNILAQSTDNLYIVGQPGGGKTFTAQELSNRINSLGKQSLYFPCSKIEEGQKLLDAIVSYVGILSGRSKAESAQYVKSCNTLILDGIDEATTVDTGLLGEIDYLAFPRSFKVSVSNKSLMQLHEFPDYISEKVSIPPRSSGKIQIDSQLNWDEARFLAFMLSDRKSTRTKLESQLRHHQRVVVTCRHASKIQLGPSFRTLRILPFNNRELERFIREYCSAAKISPDKLIQFLKSNSYIHEVCRSPLTASIMVAIYIRGGDLPSCRAELYEKRANLLLYEWDRFRGVKRPVVSSEAIKTSILALLAFEMHSNRLVELDMQAAIELCAKVFSSKTLGSSSKHVIEELIKQHGLLIEIGGKLLFGHLSHQEFFCARYIMVRQQMKILARNFYNPWWQNVILFFVGLTGTADDLLELVHKSGKLVRSDKFVKQLIEEGRLSADFSRFLIESMSSG